jgi:ribosomal protein L40E
MNPPEPQPKSAAVCWDCGATNDPDASECWLCQRRNWRSDGAKVPAAPGAFPRVGLSQVSIWIAFLAGALLLLGLAMAVGLPQVLLLSVIVLVPVGLAIGARTRTPTQPVRGQLMTNLEVTAAWSMIAAAGILLVWAAQYTGSMVFKVFLILLIPAGLITWARAQSRPMTGLQFTASVLFLAVMLPVLLLTSLVIALWLVCLATGPPSFH